MFFSDNCGSPRDWSCCHYPGSSTVAMLPSLELGPSNVPMCECVCAQAVRKSDLQTSRNQAQKRNPMEDLKREIMIMKKMKHLNIVTLTEVIDDPTGSKLLLVMEYMEGGPVMTREALERCERLPEELVARYFKDMVRVSCHPTHAEMLKPA